MNLLVFLSLALATASAVSFFEVVVEEWEAWKLIHGKAYNGDQEEKFRMKIFMENKAKIAKHNAKAMRGEKSYMLKMNEFGDLLHHEFVATMNGYRHDLRNKTHSLGATFIAPANVEFPKEVDWRVKGAVTPIKNQGTCGSCWAFSTTGSLEGQHFRRTGKLVSLSEQNLVDCSTAYGNNGCNGGLMDNAFKYIKDNGGIDTEKAYPYEAEDDQCRFTPKTVGATDKGFVDVKAGDEEDLKKAVATVGPVSVAIDASHESFQFYQNGVYHEEECSAEQLDHGVLVVGYGVDQDSGESYWLVKNSWGTTWGLEGYIKMPRNKDNMCGIASAASYPLV